MKLKSIDYALIMIILVTFFVMWMIWPMRVKLIFDSKRNYSCDFDKITGPAYTITQDELQKESLMIIAKRDDKTYMFRRDQLRSCLLSPLPEG